MSIEYDIYLKNHIAAVLHGGTWIFDNCPIDRLNAILPNLNSQTLRSNIPNHDASKMSPEEYDAYDQYFYKGGKDTYEGRIVFDYGWLHHLHNNPHHWQYWVLLEDDGSGKPKPLDMPDNFIFEMICDWWSFSWRAYFEAVRSGTDPNPYNKLYELYNWYDEHKAKMYLSEQTRVKVEQLLDLIHETLDRIHTTLDMRDQHASENIQPY